ncbi:MAG: chaperone NapD [Burkholderiales bacterium]|nr:chaperone NapD [Burkholderiales bacterium]
MNLSGILVVARPQQFDECVATLALLEGVEVHQTDAETGRIVVVQAAPAVDDEIEGLKRIQSLPTVLTADLVYHYFGDSAETEADLQAALARLADSPSQAPAD